MKKLYKHVNNRDVACEVISKDYIAKKDTYELLVYWWNISQEDVHIPYCMGILQTIKVKKKHWERDWKEYVIW